MGERSAASAAAAAAARRGGDHAVLRAGLYRDRAAEIGLEPAEARAPLRCGRRVARYCGFTCAAVRHTGQVVRRSKCNYCLGFAACFMLVFVVSTIEYAFSNTPVVFLRLAEESAGEADLLLSAASSSGYARVNYSALAARLSSDAALGAHTPRFAITQLLFAERDCHYPGNSTQLPYGEWVYTGPDGDTTNCAASLGSSNNCAQRYCARASGLVTGQLWLIDVARERRIGLGRSFPFASTAPGQVFVRKELAVRLRVAVGERIIVRCRIDSLFGDVTRSLADPNYGDYDARWRFVFLPLTVAGIMDSAFGKTDVDATDALFVDLPSFLTHVARYSHPSASGSAYLARLPRAPVGDVAPQVVLNLRNREDVYLQASYDAVQSDFISFGSRAMYRMGFHYFDAKQPVLDELKDLSFISLFTGLISGIVIVVLSSLCVVLVYSLLMINVETRSFEMGVMRMIGLSRPYLVQLLLTQALAFSLPAWAAGLAVAQLVMIPIARFLSSIGGLTISPILPGSTIGLTTGLAFVVPILSAILPIRSALGKNLHDSLDTTRSKTVAVSVSIERGSDKAVSATLIVTGIFLSVFGFIIYYLMPLALLSFNLSLLLNMFFLLLVGMLLGLVLLALNIQNIIERFIILVFFFWERLYVYDLLKKNLVAHRLRNRKTALMFSLALGFIIFMLVMAAVAVSSFQMRLEKRYGSLLTVYASTYGETSTGAPFSITDRARFETFAAASEHIEAFGWVSHDMRFARRTTLNSLKIMNVGRTNTFNGMKLRCVSPTILQAMYEGYLLLDSSDPLEPLGLMQNLYSPLGDASAIIGTVYKKELQLDIGSPFLIEQEGKERPFPVVVRDRLRVGAFVSAAPLFDLTSLPSDTVQDVLVSIPAFRRLSHGAYNSTDDIPMGTFLMQLKPKRTEAQIDAVLQELDSRTSGEVYTRDLRSRFRSFRMASNLLDIFFLFSTGITMLVCFFSLSSSMFTNIMEQAKEIAILRAIGVGRFALQRLYIYEAFVLIFSSCMTGVVIGVAIGLTMASQQTLFTQLPLSFTFPALVFGVVVVLSFIFSFLAAFGPARSIVNKNVVDALRIVT